MLQQSLSGFRELQMRLPNLQCRKTSECVMAWTVSATRFSTPTLRISLATCALTVRSSMPNGVPISLLDRPSTSMFKTCVSRSVKATWPVGKLRRLARSMNIESIRRGTQTEPWLTIRIACTTGQVAFTDRETQVLNMLVEGRSNKEIGTPLGIEERTVK